MQVELDDLRIRQEFRLSGISCFLLSPPLGKCISRWPDLNHPQIIVIGSRQVHACAGGNHITGRRNNRVVLLGGSTRHPVDPNASLIAHGLNAPFTLCASGNSPRCVDAQDASGRHGP